MAAAGELFVRDGYQATSIAAVALAAGVDRSAVAAACGPKPALLRAVVDRALGGDDEPVPPADRPWFRPVWDASCPADVLDAYAGVCALLGGRASGVLGVVHRAAGTDPEVAELRRALRADRRDAASRVAAHAARTGRLRTGLDRATDVLWLLNDPAHYGALVHGRGWPEAAFREWLAGAMRASLLPAGRDGRPAGG